jgi:diketogulonate reductase-like aldo/keto reductase
MSQPGAVHGSQEDRVPAMPVSTLNNAVAMPQLGFGVFRMTPEQASTSLRVALHAGYRLVDTAASYGNEAAVGEALATSRVPRADVFVTTKLWNADHGYDNALRAFEASRSLLGLEYLDLYLIHWPVPTRDMYLESWKALERLYADGLVRAIGVSNLSQSHLERLLAAANVVPAVNQVELHPGFPQEELREFNRQHDITTQAWSPLGQGKGLLEHPVVRQVAERNGRSPAQVVLRWHIQSGMAAIPKSVTPERIRANLAVFDFALAVADMAALSAVGSGHDRLGPDPEVFSVT